MDSKDLKTDLAVFRGDKNVVIWLDFMSPNDRRLQLDQAVEILRELKPGDLLRVTLNAKYGTLGPFDGPTGKYPKMAADKLKDQISDFLPAALTTLARKDFPAVLAGAVELAAAKALTHRTDIKIVPVLSSTYADGARMVTISCAVRPIDEGRLPAALHKWKFRSKSWDDLKHIDVPDLSLREKYHIDQRLKYPPSKIMKMLPFAPIDFSAAEQLKHAIESYKSFHRYYPAFQHVDG